MGLMPEWMKQEGDVLDRYGDATPTRPLETIQTDFDLFAQRSCAATLRRR